MDRKQERFIHEFMLTGNMTQAYSSVYRPSSPAVACSSAWRLLRKENVQARIAELRKEFARDSVMQALERREFLSHVARDNDTRVSDRLKAVDLLNRMDCLYNVGVKLSAADIGPLTIKWDNNGDDGTSTSDGDDAEEEA